MAMNKIDLLNHRFGRLLVIKSVPGKWLCRCDCGTEKTVRGGNLRSGKTTSCGCRDKERRLMPRTHGKRHTRAWRIWSGMIQRCTNPNNTKYHLYGGRGIDVCERWISFELFYSDMGDPPERHSLERKDNNKGYEPDNCKWATQQEQCRNQSRTRIFEIDGVKKSLVEWCEIKNIPYWTAHARLRRGWSITKALEIE